MTHQERQDHWQQVVEEQQSSGMKASVFCRERNVALGGFYQWRKRFGPEDSHTTAPAASDFVELLPARRGDSGVRLRLAGDGMVDVILAPGFDSETLQQAVAALRAGAA